MSASRLLTLFSAPRPFTPPYDSIQHRAVESWVRLGPRVTVVLVGDEPGIAEAAGELGVLHVPAVTRNEIGTPIIPSIFAAAEAASPGEIMCFINADILLTRDFLTALDAIRFERFLAVGRRWDLEPEYVPSLDTPGWDEALREAARRHATAHEATGIDYFAYTPGIWPSIPPFAIGRFMYDNWLIYAAVTSGAPVVDLSGVFLPVHQNHPHGRAPGAYQTLVHGPEAEHNRALAGGDPNAYTTDDAPWVLTSKGIRRRPLIQRARRRGERLWQVSPPMLRTRVLRARVQRRLRRG